MDLAKTDNLLNVFFKQYIKQNSKEIFLNWLKFPEKNFSWEETKVKIIKLAKELKNEGNSILIVVAFSTLVKQLIELSDTIKLPIGVIAAEHPDRFNLNENIQICSIQTVASRIDTLDLSRFNIYIQDEAHTFSLNVESTKKITSKLDKDFIYIGFTATPYTSFGTKLPHIEEIISTIDTKELVSRGYLSHIDYMTTKYASNIDYSKFKTNSNGEYSAKELDEILAIDSFISNSFEAMDKLGTKDKKVSYLLILLNKLIC